MNRSVPVSGRPGNKILAQLPASNLERLLPSLVKVQFVRDQVLVACNQRPDQLLFIEQGIASVSGVPADAEPPVQVAMIGPEGIVGDLSRFDLRQAASLQVTAFLPGIALRLAGDEVDRALDASPALRQACVRVTQSLSAQIMQHAACSAQLSLTERCARWMAMTYDRIDGDEIRVTHEALSSMLGIRRSGIAFAMGALQQSGLIRTGRGRFTVLDRVGLGRVARGTAPRADGGVLSAGPSPLNGRR